MEGLSLLEDPKTKRSEAGPKLGKPIAEKTSQATPPLIPMMPSTNQHVGAADLVASVMRSQDTDPAVLSGIGKRVPGED